MADEPRALILVVEDDPGVATLQRRRLERANFNVRVATSVDVALSTLASDNVALVLMDYRLGPTTGLDLHRRMKAAGFDVPVIIVSASMDDATVIEAMRAGVRDVVLKNTGYLDYLPDAVKGVLNQAAIARERLSFDSEGSHVLIVEDDSPTAVLEQRQLERAGYDVEVVSTREAALDALRKGRVNLVVLDLRLGNGMSGLDLYDEMKQAGVTVPAILVTAFPDQMVAIRALRAGIRDVVPKTTDYLEYLPAAADRVIAQVRVERKLVDSELRLASIIGTTMDAIVMCDDQMRIVLFNRSAEEMFRCGAATVLGQRLDRYIPGLTLEATAAHAGPPGTVRQRFEVDAVCATGERVPIELSVSDVVVHERRLFTVIARDVSERRRIEAELREADRRKDEFLGMLAHELRNPLAAIMTAGEVLHRRMHDPALLKLTAVVKRQTQALARMVDDLLDVSRVTLGKIQIAQEPLLLGEVTTRAIEGLRETITGAGLRLESFVDTEPVWLKGDATRLEQVLANLLTNAVKFTPPGGVVRVEARREGGEAVVRVRDTGIGIEAALLSKVFDLFVQGDMSLDRSKSGLGIGLALVRQVVALHGGTVTAHSEGPGKGSEFVVRIPAVPQEALAPRDEPVEVHAERRLRVLVVDDQRDLADNVGLLVEMAGHEAQVVYDGETAIETGRHAPPDVMLVDIGMPGMTGYEVAERVRRDPAFADVRLVALTGYGREEDRERVMRSGFDLHVVKPVTEAGLREALAAMAAARSEVETTGGRLP